MKALFTKEFRQGRPLLVFALLVGLLVPLLYAALLRAYPLFRTRPDDLAGALGGLILLVPPILAFFAGCGLFAAEVDRDTASLLFSLPLSRRRIWLAKLLAGLALTLIGSLIVLGLTRLLLPVAHRALPTLAYAPDVIAFTTFAFSVALFCSVLTSNANAAVALSGLLAGGLVGGALAIWSYLGPPLLGYDPILDIALWCLAMAPGLLLASAFVVSRGELLRSLPSRLLALPVFLLTFAVMMVLMAGVARWLTRYQRADVLIAAPYAHERGGQVLPIITLADPVPLRREPPHGWSARSPRGDGMSYVVESDASRQNYGLLLDLKTAREVYSQRIDTSDSPTFAAAVSPDGRLAAVLVQPAGLTWGLRGDRRTTPPGRIRIFELKSGKRLYEGLPQRLEDNEVSDIGLQWSPTGAYVLIVVGRTRLYSMRPDGSEFTRLRESLKSWTFAPGEDVLYGTDATGTLWRQPLGGGLPEEIWSPPVDASTGAEQHASLHGLSANGQWAAVFIQHVVADRERGVGREAQYLWAVRTDGAKARLLWERPWEEPTPGPYQGLRGDVWAAEGAVLYYALARLEGKQIFSTVFRWRPTDAAPVALPIDLTGWVRLYARPDPNEIILWSQERGGPGRVWHGVTDGTVLLLGPDGEARPVSSRTKSRELAMAYWLTGFTSDGRGVLSSIGPESLDQGRSTISLLDFDTGAVEQVYP